MRSPFGVFVLAVLVGCSDGVATTPQGASNQPPTLALLAPGNGFTVPAGASVQILYSDDDPDDIATTDLFADRDGDLGTTGDQIVIATNRPESNGAMQSVTWDTTGAAPGTYTLIGRTTDGRITAVDEVSGTVTIGASGSTVAFARTDGAASPADLAVDTDGSFIVVDDFVGTATLGAGAAGEESFSAPDLFQDSFIARYNADGSFAWASHITGERQEHARAVLCLADGSCLVTGNYENTAVFGAGEVNETTLTAPDFSLGNISQNVFVALYNAGGTLAWARDVVHGERILPEAIAGYADGSFVLTGQMSSEATFGPGDANETMFDSLGNAVVFVARYDADASLVWARHAGGAQNDRGRAIATFADGSCVATGTLTGAAVFGAGEPNETTLTSVGTQDTFVACYNADGTLGWAVGAGGTDFSSTTGVGSLADGSCIVLGYFTKTKVFGLGEPNETTLTEDGFDVFIARYNADGSLAWVRQEGGPDQDIAHDLAMLADGSFVLAGGFHGTTTYGVGDANETMLTSGGGQDSVVARYNVDGTLVWARRDGGPDAAVATGVGILPNGSVIAAGVFGGTATFGAGEPNETTLTAIGTGSSLFIARFDPN